jgi:poly(3-hydroxybutyrate) depolymerase
VFHSILISLVTCFAIPAQDPAPEDVVGALTKDILAAVDLTTPKERHAAGLAIAKRKEATIANLRAAIDACYTFPAATPGMHIERAPIWADGKVEDVELVVYVPKKYDPKVPAPLLEVFHGTGGSGKGEDLMWRETCESLGMLLIAPSEAGANEGYAFSQRERDAAVGAVRWMQRKYNVDESRVFATGESRGGHLSWDAALRRPDRYAAIAPLIGSPRFQIALGQNNLRFLENLVDVPIRDLQGSKDDPGLLQNVREAFAKLAKFGAKDVKLVEFPDRGHDFDFKAIDWVDYFGRGRRPTLRESLVFTSANLEEARAFWVEITRFTKDVAENPRITLQALPGRAMDAAEQRRAIQEQIDHDTARIEIKMQGKGHFMATAKGVASFRVLLTSEMFDAAQPVEIEFNGRISKRKVSLDPKTLLSEFVERFDRTFLPVASIETP